MIYTRLKKYKNKKLKTDECRICTLFLEQTFTLTANKYLNVFYERAFVLTSTSITISHKNTSFLN